MKEPVLDHPFGVEVQTVKSVKGIVWWTLVLLTGAHFLTYFIQWMLLQHFLRGLVGQSDAIMWLRSTAMGSGLLLMALIGDWWGRSLANNLTLPLWKICLFAFAVSLFPNLLYNVFLWFEWAFTGSNLSYTYRLRLDGLLLSAGTYAFIFSGIVLAVVHSYRRGRFQFVYFAAILFILLAAYFFYFNNWWYYEY